MYPGEAVPVGPGFVGPRSIEEQTEPVDFSTANEPVNFSSAVRPMPAFSTAAGTTGGYSREYVKVIACLIFIADYAPMSPHPGYAMAGVQAEYPANSYTPYPTAAYSCGGGTAGYPGAIPTSYPPPVSSGYSPGPCYSMPPPQHPPPQLEKSPSKDDG
ncbi:hypothetical protein C0J52_07399 [Blattella germanica]|nr:hypothetical protein C0J52_07399 [Blattella germanica]